MRITGVSKAEAVKEILAESPADAVVAYLGDDLTDEDAFVALGARGAKILVSERSRPTAADIRLEPPEELLAFLDNWSSS